MSNNELKEALYSREPVCFLGMQYDYVSAVIYRVCQGELYITAELMDVKENSVTITRAEQVERCSTNCRLRSDCDSMAKAKAEQEERSERECG